MSQETPLVESPVVDDLSSSSSQQEVTSIPQPAEETLFEHEVIELESFNERKTWIEEKISFLEKMPPIEVFVGLEALKTSAEEIPGLPTRSDLQQWIVEHDAIEKETEIFDTGELKKLRNFTRAATQRNLSPEDTDLIELTLTTIYELDRLLHLLRDRSENLDLLSIRLTWEEHRIASWHERRKIIAEIQTFLDQQARWSSSVYLGSELPDPERDLDSTLSSPAFSRANRIKLADALSRDAAQFASRVSTLRHGSITSAGRMLDKLIDNSRKPVPDVLLDEQDRLEEQGINAMENIGKFIMNVVMQWRKADDIYVESLKDQATAEALLSEVESALKAHPTSHLSASFITRSDALSRRLTLRGDPMSPASSFPCPTHPMFLQQEPFNSSLARFLSSEISTASDLSKKARTLAEEYRSRLEAVQRVQELMKTADKLSDKFVSVIHRLENGISSIDGDGTPPNLMSKLCLEPTAHSIFLALLPSLNNECLEAEDSAKKLLQSIPSALLHLNFLGLENSFRSNVASTTQKLSDLRSQTQTVRDDVAARVARLKKARKIWDVMHLCLEELENIRREIGEAMEKHRWRDENRHNGTPPTPESPQAIPLPPNTSQTEVDHQLVVVGDKLAQDIDGPLVSLSSTLEAPLRDYLHGSANGLKDLLQKTKQMVQLLSSLQSQSSILNSVQEEFHDLQLRIENVGVLFDDYITDTFNNRLQEMNLNDAINEARKQSSEVYNDASTFISSLAQRVPFISRQRNNVTFVKRPFSSVDLKLGFTERQPIELPFDLHSVDDAVRATSNTIVMRLNGDIHRLEQKENHLELSQAAHAVDSLLIQTTSLINKAVFETSAVSSSFSTVMSSDNILQPLEALLEDVEVIGRDNHSPISRSFSHIRTLLKNMENSPGVSDHSARESLFVARTRTVDDAELKFNDWDDGLQSLHAQIIHARDVEFQRLEGMRRAEESRLREQKEAEEARLAAEEAERIELEQQLERQRGEEELRRQEEERAAQERKLREEQASKEAEEARLKQERAEAAERKRLEDEERNRFAENERLAFEKADKARLQRERSELELKLRQAEQELAEQRRLQAEKDIVAEQSRARLEEQWKSEKEMMQNYSHEDEDVFGTSTTKPPQSTPTNALYGQVLKLRKRLSSLDIKETVHSSPALPSKKQSQQMFQRFSVIKAEVSGLPDSAEDPALNTQLKLLRLDVEALSKDLLRVDILASLSTKIEQCDTLLSDLLEHIDSYPAAPLGLSSSCYELPTNLPSEQQLEARLVFIKSTINELSSALQAIAEDKRAISEHDRILQTWQELEEMANDRLTGRKSRPSSVISSGRSSRSSSSKKVSKASGYSNLSAKNQLLPPISKTTARRAVSSTDQPPERPSTSSKTFNRSTSGPLGLTLYGTTFSSRQRTTSLTPADRRASGPTFTPRATKRSASPSVSDTSSYSHSKSSASISTWSRAPRPSFPLLPRATPPKKPPPRKAYIANPKNKLDVAVGDVVNNLPVDINIESVSGSWKDQSGKYWIGDQDPKLCFCRILRSQTVMVRVGGGWTELSKFIRDHFAEAFRLLDSPPNQPGGAREEKWISSSTLLEASENDSPQVLPIPKTPEPKDQPLPSLALSTPSGSPRSLRSTPSTKGSPLTALQFMRRADLDSPFLRPETPSKAPLRPRNTPMNTAARNSIWRP